MPAAKRVTKEMYEQMLEWSHAGHTKAWVAHQWGWHSDTLTNRMKTDAQLKGAWELGKELERDDLFQAIRTKAMTGSMAHAAAYAREMYGDELNPQRNDNGRSGGVTIVVNHNLLGSNDTCAIQEKSAVIEGVVLEPEQVSDH